MQKFVSNRAKCQWGECYISIVSPASDRATNLTKRYAEACNVPPADKRQPAEGYLKGCRAIAPKGQRKAIAHNPQYKNRRKESTSACR